MSKIALLTIFWISVAASGCMHRAPSLKMLEARADYDESAPENAKIFLGETSVSAVPTRTKPKTAHVWVYEHELPDGSYFWGSWLTVTVEGSRWAFEKKTIKPQKQRETK